MVLALDEGLKSYEQVLIKFFGKEVNFPGAGAGGGVLATLSALATILVRPGVEVVQERMKLPDLIQQADVIITGEGKMDYQTLQGKVVQGICTLAGRFHKPVLALVGKNELSAHDQQKLGIQNAISLISDEISERQAMEAPIPLIRQRVREQIIPLLLSLGAG
jgi:glycerate kinase